MNPPPLRGAHTSRYYADRLSADRLRRCYEIAPPRVQQYLEAEVEHLLQKIGPGDSVLELGCGYGRILPRLSEKAASTTGIDTSRASLLLARGLLDKWPGITLLEMDAARLAFRGAAFDRVACIQNGISAFHVDRQTLIRESIRVTRPGGTILFSTYSDRFWEHRLEWFRLQSEEELLGEIDDEKTGNGRIVCKDGFTATTVSPDEFLSLTADLDVSAQIVEVDESSLFCELTPRGARP
jgi:SAM-dependent methyltransferase